MSTETTTTETETKQATNTVVLFLQGEDGNRTKVAEFEAGSKVGETTYKSPKRALGAFIAAVAKDASHELNSALRQGRLQHLSGHVQSISVEMEPTIVL